MREGGLAGSRSSPRDMDAFIASIMTRGHRRIHAWIRRSWSCGAPAAPSLRNRFENATSPGTGPAWPEERLRAARVHSRCDRAHTSSRAEIRLRVETVADTFLLLVA